MVILLIETIKLILFLNKYFQFTLVLKLFYNFQLIMILESKLGKVAAILSDFDGTLCPTSDIGCGYYNDSAMIPQILEDILNKISLTIPIGIVTSKDFDFIYPKTKKFAKILSCVLV
ncbi:protein of unknown function [Candidatus Nitrosocosmicus franklandus]|uniref:Uncharacterized protein n=2 Tax=Candidatus Nitrosocosmicus franklandianus TaxID=1798806 RepID=A0A484IF51_9ARCH|nr:protein of unknown function [Candidatus Nitrosocosmicus franklandus]